MCPHSSSSPKKCPGVQETRHTPMRATSLGDRVPRTATAPPRPTSPLSSPSTSRRALLLPWTLPLVALPLLLVVALGLRVDHAHPHVHEERFLWQTNVFLNVVIVYLSLETAFPLVQHAVSRLGSRVVDVGLHCDYLTLWGAALACLLPVEFYAAAGDVTVSRALLTVVYVGFAFLVAIRSRLFVREIRAALTSRA